MPAIVLAAPLEVFGRLPSIEAACLSPDGSRMALVRTSQDDRLLAVVSLQDNAMLGGMRLGNTKLRGIEWADDSHVMVFTSETSSPWRFRRTHEWYQLQVYDVATRQAQIVPKATGNSLHFLASDTPIMNVISGPVMVRHVDGHTLLFVHGYYLNKQRILPMLIRYDVNTERQKLIREGTPDDWEWLVDAAGDVVAEQGYDNYAQRWRIRIRKNGGLAEAASGQESIDAPEFLGFGPAGDAVLVRLFVNGDPVWKLLSLQDGTFSAALAEGRNLDGAIRDPETNRLIGGAQVDDTATYVFFEPKRQAQWNAIVRAFGGDHVHFVSASRNFSKLIVSVDGPNFGYSYHLVDMSTLKAEPLGDIYEGLSRSLPVQRITYPASDKLPIPAYLTLPDRQNPVKLPLIVLPHGGPATRDTADFYWFSQALADQGYAVLQPNFRGSDINWKFVQAGFGEFGRRMQSDLSDGVRYLADKGTIDPNRVCIVGASYGGYAALAGASLDSATYRCAVSISGLSDLSLMLKRIQARHNGESSIAERYWDRFLGAVGPDDPVLKALSPINHLGDIRAPILLIHGKDDTVVDFEQSESLYEALTSAHKEVEFLRLKGEDHWLSRSETRLQMLQATVRFLRSHNPPQ